MIDSQRGAKRRVGYNQLISNKREWNNCFIKNNREILLDLTDFAVQERPEGNLMVAISRPWYNCSYTMAAKPIKSLELHYTMMQFLIKLNGSQKVNTVRRAGTVTLVRHRVTSNFLPKQLAMFHSTTVTSPPAVTQTSFSRRNFFFPLTVRVVRILLFILEYCCFEISRV